MIIRKVVFLFVILVVVTNSQGEIITVDDNDIADFSNIQAAIDYAVNGDIIIVQPGVYEEDINFLGKNIILTSTNPENPDIVSETIIGGKKKWIVFRGSEDPNCALTGFNVIGHIQGFDPSINPDGENHTHATISYCIFQGNCSGVIHSCDGTINRCVIVDNSNPHCVYTVPLPAIDDCRGLIKNCTIVNNYSYAVGLTWHPGAVTIENCIIYNNGNSSDEPQIIVGSEMTVNISYCNLQLGTDGIIGDGVVNWGPGNIDADPCFARVGYWEYYDPNWVLHAGDYHLQSEAGRWDSDTGSWVIDANTSACIDVGNPGCPTNSEPSPNGNRINIGAYGGTATASKSPENWRSIADLTNDGIVDFYDLAIFTEYWLRGYQCLPSDLDRSLMVDMVDFAIFANEW